MTLRAMMIISHAVQHRVQHHLRIPGPRGVLARQIVEMGELLETVQLDKVVNQLSRALQERSLQEVESRSPTLGDISSRARTGENIIQPDGTSDTEVIADDTNFNGWTTTHARLETSQHAGDSPGPGHQQGGTEVPLPPRCCSVDLQDGGTQIVCSGSADGREASNAASSNG